MLLHNNHNVYILGAGFSYDAGLPLVSDFLIRMRDSHEWLVKENRTREAKAVANVLEFRLNAASAAYWANLDLENIEELFSLASASASDITADIRLAIAATLDYARKIRGDLKCKIGIRQSEGLFDSKTSKWPSWAKLESNGFYKMGTYALYVANLLGMLKDGKPQGENTFITFNYDTVLEDALHDLRIPVTYGSSLGTPLAKIKSALGSVPVFKLHGSVNWARTSDEGGPIKIFSDYAALAKEEFIPDLVPPTWKKIFENEIEDVWDEAISKLNTATRIIVIGFSLPPTDMHFKYLLAAGLHKNISLRNVLFVNPDEKNELKPRATQLLRQAYIESGRITFNKETLEQFTIYHRQRSPDSIGLNNLGRETEYALQYDFHNSK